MTTTARVSLLALAVAVVAAVTIGTVIGSDEAEAVGTQHTLRIPAAAFTPIAEDAAYYRPGHALGAESADPGRRWFHAPVFLEGNTATVHSFSLHYLDNGMGEVCATIWRNTMKTWTTGRMSVICTRNSSHEARTRIDTTIRRATVDSDQAMFVSVTLDPTGSYQLLGVTIVYTSDV